MTPHEALGMLWDLGREIDETYEDVPIRWCVEADGEWACLSFRVGSPETERRVGLKFRLDQDADLADIYSSTRARMAAVVERVEAA